MGIVQLEIKQFRNLAAVSFELAPQFNLFFGANGSGKTSILEAIYFLSLGRSFRSSLAKNVLHYSAEKCSVFGILKVTEDLKLPLGVEKQRQGKTIFKINSVNAASTAEIAKLLPVQLINQDSFQFLLSGPKFRRQLLDWGVFHVEPDFYPVWKRWQRSLLQRNAALRQAETNEQIQLWDPSLVSNATLIAKLRKSYIKRIKPIFAELIQQLLGNYPIEIRYLPGWDESQDLHLVLQKSLTRDRLLGYTQSGPHRADLKITIDTMPAQDILSRGEQKVLVCAWQLAQGKLLKQETMRSSIYLVDDLPAELDYHHREQLLEALLMSQAQVIITSIEKQLWTRSELPLSLFHVEHGNINSA